jgi:sensor histidine kinase YesM
MPFSTAQILIQLYLLNFRGMKMAQYITGGNRLKVHIAFCIVVLAFLLLGMYFLHVTGFRFNNLISAFTDCLFFLFCIYAGRWLCQKWYLEQKLILFFLYTLLACICLAIFKWLLVCYVFNNPYAGFIEVVRDAMPFFLIGLVIGMFLKLIRTFLQKELQDAQIKAEQKEGEFSLLQSQLSPHFLFNVLNNLYGISIEEHERIPALLLKLSHLLRYTVYGDKKLFVPLKEELEYIKNYIEFEQIRISDRLNLVTDIAQVNNTGIKIAPQVLIVFIENAFKHSKNTLNQEIDIDISLKITGNFICLLVSNSYQQQKNNDTMLNESSGLGLANTIKRLDLLYGNDYELKQATENDLYHVELNLKIKE